MTRSKKKKKKMMMMMMKAFVLFSFTLCVLYI